ncbi:MAG: hypothetical protein AAF647_02185 [Pseudomonadota bacterium]
MFDPTHNAALGRLEVALANAANTDARWLILEGAAVTSGGAAKRPEPGNTWDSKMWEIDVLGVSATDADMGICVAIWRKAAHRVVDISARLAEAEAALLGSGSHSVADLIEHCHVVMAHHGDGTLREAARQVRDALRAAEPKMRKSAPADERARAAA